MKNKCPRVAARQVRYVPPRRLELAHCWDKKSEAIEHARGLRRSSFGVDRLPTYEIVKIKEEQGQYCVYVKEHKLLLQTMRGERC